MEIDEDRYEHCKKPFDGLKALKKKIINGYIVDVTVNLHDGPYYRMTETRSEIMDADIYMNVIFGTYHTIIKFIKNILYFCNNPIF